MNRHLLLLIAISLLLVSWFINCYGYLRTWFAHLRTKPSVAKRRRKNKSRLCPFPPRAVVRQSYGNHRHQLWQQASQTVYGRWRNCSCFGLWKQSLFLFRDIPPPFHYLSILYQQLSQFQNIHRRKYLNSSENYAKLLSRHRIVITRAEYGKSHG